MIIGGLLALALSGMAGEEGESPTPVTPYDCHFCRVYMAEEGMMQVCPYEIHPARHGLMRVTYVAEEWEEKFDLANDSANKLWEKFDPSAPPTMCATCQSFADAWDSSVSMENFGAFNVRIMLLTSDSPEKAKEIRAIAVGNEP
jgi:hypothetical protein